MANKQTTHLIGPNVASKHGCPIVNTIKKNTKGSDALCAFKTSNMPKIEKVPRLKPDVGSMILLLRQNTNGLMNG